MPTLSQPIPVHVTAVPHDPQFLTRAELSATVARGAAIMVGVVAKDIMSSTQIQRTLIEAGAATATSGGSVLDVVDQVIDGIITGSDITPVYPTIARLIHAQEQRSEVIEQLLLTNDYKRIGLATRARDHLEESLFAQALNDELLPAERVILLDKLDGIIADTRKKMAGQNGINDVVAMLEKIDYATEAAGADLKKRFSKTTPQGREVVRKLLMTVGKAVRAADGGDRE